MILGGLASWVSLWVRFGGCRFGCRGYLLDELVVYGLIVAYCVRVSYSYSEGWGLGYRFSFITC